MQYKYRTEDSFVVQKMVKLKQELSEQIKEIEYKLGDIAWEHLMAIQA